MEQRRQFADFIRRNAANICRPRCRFRHPIGLARQEFNIVPAVFYQRMGDPQHHRHVGAHMGGNPLGAVAEEIHGFRAHRVNADDALAAFAQRVEIPNPLLVAGIPGNFQRIERVGAPEHHHVGMRQHQRPAGLLLVHLVPAHDIRHDRLRCTGGVIPQMTGIAARQAHIALQQRRGLVQHAVRTPAVGAGKNGRRTVSVANALVLGVDQRQRVIPAHANKLILTANALRLVR